MEKIHLFETFDCEDWSEKDFQGHRFYQCQLNHIRLGPNTNLYGVELHSCLATYIEAEGFEFNHFSANNTDFKSSNFKNTVWKRSRIFKSDFSWVTFEGADLQDCGGDGSDFYLSKIHKAKSINPFDRDMISEVVRFYANGDPDVLMCAALIKSAKDFCWREFKSYTQLSNWKKAAEFVISTLNRFSVVQSIINNEFLKKG